ncbi:MAG: membrane protein insertion efficiency factor YidD [Candidatus Zixiibacteriota bacterium]
MSVNCLEESTSGPGKTPLTVYPFLLIIWIYRWTLSPIMGNGCRFHPTCSHYAEDALKKYGVLKGGWMALKRIGRCHPWHEGGFDPVN